MDGPARPKIRDIAERAGVSPTTVSHVLNRVEGARVAESTRLRVEQVATELSYSPNGFARALRTNRSYSLALVSDEIATTPYAGRLILGAQEEASRLGYVLLIMTTGGHTEVEEREVAAVWQHQVDGVLYAATAHRVVTVPASLAGKPVFLVNAETADDAYWCTYPDEEQGGYIATRELTQAGHERIAFINTSEKIPAQLGRLAGYRSALKEAQIPFRRHLVAHGRYSFAEYGYAVARKLLSQQDRPTALFCFNDRMAMGAYRAAYEMGLSIPDDISVVGFDNQEIIADALYPSLTTVALPYYEMGASAVRALVNDLDDADADPHARRVVIANSLIRRHSVRAI